VKKPVVARSRNGVPIRLTEERWRHIVSGHPEMMGLQDEVLRTVGEPELVQEGDFGTLLAVRFERGTSLTDKYVIVVYRKVSPLDGFIITAYLATRPSAGRRTIWRR